MTNDVFPRSSVTTQSTDAAQEHARKVIQQSEKLKQMAQTQIENHQKYKNNSTITQALKIAKKQSEIAIQLGQESLQYAESAASSQGEASHQAFQQAVQAHVQAAKAQHQANQALYTINQGHLAVSKQTRKDNS